jgi:hypothetical protein
MKSKFLSVSSTSGRAKTKFRSLSIVFSVTVALLSFASLGRAAVYCVRTDGNDANDGSSWLLAKRTVSSALTASSAGDQIWIARGTYAEKLVISKAVALYGGFAGAETDLTQRNWAANLSVLDGSTTGTVINVGTVGAAEARIDGLVITNGSATSGAGIRTTACAPTIANNVIAGNTANGGPGGAIGLWRFNSAIGNQAVITNNLIRLNKTLANTTWDGNAAGIAVIGCSPLIAWNRFVQNNAAGSGGAIACFLDSHPLIANNQIVANSASLAPARSQGYGGGIYATGESYDPTTGQSGVSAPVLINNLVAANGAHSGAGIALTDSRGGVSLVKNNTVIANSGAGVFWANAGPTFLNNLVAFNAKGMCLEVPYGTPVLSHNNVYGNAVLGTRSDYVGIADPTGTSGNLSAEPRLANSSIGDGRLQPDSPCRNAGLADATVLQWPDLEGRYRTDGALDIGAYESIGVLLDVPSPVVRVSKTGSNGDGSTWANAKTSVQAAIAALSGAGLRGGEVWVAQGKYQERVLLPAFIYLYGGFAGTETARAARDPVAHRSVLDGGGNVMPMYGANAPVVTNQNGGYLTCALDGFTVTHGGEFTDGWGGGWNGGAGGAIYCYVSSPIIANNLICSNSLGSPGTCPTYGGGFYGYQSHALITGNTFTRNEALCALGEGKGGAFYCTRSCPTIEGNMFNENRGCSGSGIFADQESSLLISRNTIATNWFYCTGISFHGPAEGAIALKACKQATITGNRIQGNRGGGVGGGGMYVQTESAVICNNLVLDNVASSCNDPANPTDGGGLYGVFAGPGPVFIYNNTFVGNWAVPRPATPGLDSGAIYLTLGTMNVALVNNIFAFNSGGVGRNPASTAGVYPVLLNNCWYGNTNANFPGVTLGPTEITNRNPQFANLSARDCHLLASSPCVDAASPNFTPATDLDGLARPLDGNQDGVAVCDIGAYEAVPVVWKDVFNEPFENGFPGAHWTLYGNPSWGATTYAAHGGTHSVWCAGSALQPAGGYTNAMAAWMIYGPFNLADARDATVRFWYKNNSEPGRDGLWWGASTNATTGYGWPFFASGDQNPWREQVCSLADVGSLGSLCGKSQVWIAFVFTSDSANCGPTYTGAFLDDVLIQKAVNLPPRPQINCGGGTFGYRSNRFEFTMSGSSGQVVIVESSTNLVNWQSLITNTLGSGPLYFCDSGCTNLARRFYRLRLP